MSKCHVVNLSQVSGVDLDYCPQNYFSMLDVDVGLPSRVAGETRRQIFRALIEAGSPVPEGLDAEVLDDETREEWVRLHPTNMGGEYLPPLRKGEVEIARISLASVTADQISVRARRSGTRTAFRIIDEYESTYICRPAGSTSPLSLRELIALIESACEGGSIIFPILNNLAAGSSTRADVEAFITVTSDFYPHLGPYYRAVIDAWANARRGGSRDT